jgi:bifunctional non-homologous end joining protein LigD
LWTIAGTPWPNFTLWRQSGIRCLAEGTLRHPSYLGLREDKKPEAVVLETEHHAADQPGPATSSVVISSRDRIIYPESNITKGQVADHYAAVAAIMLPWAGSRPISLVRCPQGRAKQCFFQKHDAGSFGDKVRHIGVVEKDGHEEPYLYVDDADGLMTCVQKHRGEPLAKRSANCI